MKFLLFFELFEVTYFCIQSYFYSVFSFLGLDVFLAGICTFKRALLTSPADFKPNVFIYLTQLCSESLTNSQWDVFALIASMDS